MTKMKSKNPSNFVSIRVKSESKNKAGSILSMANKKRLGRKVKLPELFDLAIGLLTDDHIQLLQEKSMTNEDRKEVLRQKYIERRGTITKDDFTGFMMKPEFLDFMKDQEVGP